MAHIEVDYNQITNAKQRLLNIKRSLNDIADDISYVRDHLDWEVASKKNIDSSLRRIFDAAKNESSSLLRYGDFLDSVITAYKGAEESLANIKYRGTEHNNGYSGLFSVVNSTLNNTRVDEDDKLFYDEIRKFINDLMFQKKGKGLLNMPIAAPVMVTGLAVYANTIDVGQSDGLLTTETTMDKLISFLKGDIKSEESKYIWQSPDSDDNTFFRVLDGTYSESRKPTFFSFKDDEIIGEHLDVKVDQQKRDIKQINKETEWYGSPEATIFAAGVKKELTGAVIDAKAEGEGDFAKGSIEGAFLTGEVHGNASAGFYVYEKKDDGTVKEVFSPGVAAEVGVSASVLSVEGEGRIGIGENKNLLGVYGEVEADVLTAEAEAKLGLSLKEVYAGVSAEADLAKIEGSAGVSVLGTDIGLTGGLKVGVGAHAKVGVTDGKLKVDVGAALGPGFDLGLEIDMSGTVDAVCDTVESVWDSTVNAVNNAKSTIDEIGNIISEIDSIDDIWSIVF